MKTYNFRQKYLYAAISFLLITFFNHKLLSAGGIDSGGGTYPENRTETAWYVGTNKKIFYCLKMSPSFQMQSDRVQQNIKEAIQTWKRFYQKVETLKKESWLINFNFTEISNCKKADLKFLLGDHFPETQAMTSKRLNFLAYAQAVRNKENNWATGFIHIKENFTPQSNNTASRNRQKIRIRWEKENHLKAILLHELGHIFGVGHLPKTIMDQDIVLKLNLFDTETIYSNFLTPSEQEKIEHQYMLSPNFSISSVISLNLPNDRLLEKKTLVLKERVTYKLKIEKETHPTQNFTFLPQGRMKMHSANYNDNQRFFTRYIIENGRPQFIVSAFFESDSIMGTLTNDQSKKSYPAIYKKNRDSFAHQLLIYKHGVWVLIFNDTNVHFKQREYELLENQLKSMFGLNQYDYLSEWLVKIHQLMENFSSRPPKVMEYSYLLGSATKAYLDGNLDQSISKLHKASTFFEYKAGALNRVNLRLAQLLLKKGKWSEVSVFLQNLLDRGFRNKKVEKFLELIQQKRMPNFGNFLYY